MQLHWSNRLSFKLATTAVIIAFAVGVLLSIGQVYLDYLDEKDLLEEKVMKSLQVSKLAATRAVLILDSDLAQEVVSGLLEYDYIIEASILDDHDTVLAERKRVEALQLEKLEWARMFIDDMKPYQFRLTLPEAMAEDSGSLHVIVDQAVGLQPFFSRAVTTFLSGFIRNLLLVMLLYLVFYHILTRPLSQVVESIAKIDPEHPGEQRIEKRLANQQDELGLLVTQINTSFDAVQILLDNLRSTNRALSASEEALRRRSWELEKEVERTRETARELVITKEEAEAANRAKSVFLANVSHELRTPLNAIIGFASIMSEQLFGPIKQVKYQEYLEDIKSSSQHLSDILGEVLDLAKIEAGQMKLESEEFDLIKLCEESKGLVAAQAAMKRLMIVMDIDADLPLVYGDRLRIKQSVLNLLTNAVKFTPEGEGSVDLKAGLSERGDIRISVSDHGIGIPEDEQELVFSPFMRSATALSRSHEGTGLGLSIVKAFVEEHGGTIELYSVSGQGSTFTITLPASMKVTDAQKEA